MEQFIKASVQFPDLTPSRLVILNLSDRKLHELLTPARLELVRVVKQKRPNTIGELARLVNRPLEAVSRDLRLLSWYSLIDLVQVGRTKRPTAEKDLVVLTLNS